jgi:hypothetical protein
MRDNIDGGQAEENAGMSQALQAEKARAVADAERAAKVCAVELENAFAVMP